MKPLAVLLGVLLASTSFGSPSEKEIKSRLDFHLLEVERSARSDRHWGGAGSIAGGALLGALALVSNNSSDPQMRDSGTLYFGIVGGVAVVSGIIKLLVPTPFETEPRRYRLMPSETSIQLQGRNATGEATLRRLSDDARRQRLISGGTLAVLGIAEVVLSTTSTPGSFRDILFYQGIVTAGLSILKFLIQDRAELEWRAYQDWRNADRVTFDWDILPMSGGALTTASIRF